MRVSAALAVICLCVVFAFRPVGSDEDGARFLQTFMWEASDPDFGGFSAILTFDDGTRGLVLNDKGVLFEVGIRRGDQTIQGVDILGKWDLDEEWAENDTFLDTEGLAMAPDGGVYISYEFDNQIIHYDRTGGTVEPIETPIAFKGIAENRGLESLAIDPDGQLYTLAERPRTQGRGFSVWRRSADGWERPFNLWARDGFLAVSAEFGPDGRFYLLERRVTVLGFQTRLRRWEVTQDAAMNETTLLTTRAGQFGNLEGLSLWRNPSGQLIATMVADDNFWSFLPTQIVEYALTE